VHFNLARNKAQNKRPRGAKGKHVFHPAALAKERVAIKGVYVHPSSAAPAQNCWEKHKFSCSGERVGNGAIETTASQSIINGSTVQIKIKNVTKSC